MGWLTFSEPCSLTQLHSTVLASCQWAGTTPTSANGARERPTCAKVEHPEYVVPLLHVHPPGTILRGYLENSAEQYSRIVYVGDGKNDLCPLLRLDSDDVGVVRKGYGLEKALARGSHDMKATIHIVDFLHELGNVIVRLCA